MKIKKIDRKSYIFLEKIRLNQEELNEWIKSSNYFKRNQWR